MNLTSTRARMFPSPIQTRTPSILRRASRRRAPAISTKPVSSPACSTSGETRSASKMPIEITPEMGERQRCGAKMFNEVVKQMEDSSGINSWKSDIDSGLEVIVVRTKTKKVNGEKRQKLRFSWYLEPLQSCGLAIKDLAKEMNRRSWGRLGRKVYSYAFKEDSELSGYRLRAHPQRDSSGDSLGTLAWAILVPPVGALMMLQTAVRDHLFPDGFILRLEKVPGE